MPHANESPLLLPLLRALTYGVLVALATWSFVSPSFTLACAGLAALAVVAVERDAFSSTWRFHFRTPLSRVLSRLPRVPVLAAMLAVIVYLVAELLRQSSWPSQGLGAELTHAVAEFLAWPVTLALVVLALRSLARRHPSLVVFELAVLLSGLGLALIAHENGALHRPFELADPILVRGGDPKYAFYAIAIAVTFAVFVVLLERSHSRKVLSRLLWVAALLGAMLYFLWQRGVPALETQTRDALGVRNEGNAEGGSGSGQPSDGPDFSDSFNPSPHPMALVLFHDEYSPPSSVYYFRQASFSRFNGRRLVSASDPAMDRDARLRFPAGSATDVDDAPSDPSVRGAIETTVGLLEDHSQPFALESPVTLTPLANPNRSRFRRTYRVRSMALTADPFALFDRQNRNPLWSEETVQTYTRGPDDPRYRELARQIIAAAPEQLRTDPYGQTLAVIDWLNREGTYSLHAAHTSASDPTASFLFGDRTGYCVHFAHAAVFLLRSRGIVSRVSTGYMSPESARRGGSALLLSGANSHAWPEIYLDGVGWVVVDVSPERALDAGPPPPDGDLQQMLAELLRGATPLSADGRETLSSFEDLGRNVRLVLRFLGLLVLMVLLFVAYGTRAWIALAASRRPQNARLQYRYLLMRLADVGFVRPYGQSHAEWLERVESVRDFAQLAALATEERFAGTTRPEQVVAQKRRASEQFAKQFARWRRWLSHLRPDTAILVLRR